MMTMHIPVSIFDSPDDAPNYDASYTAVTIKNVCIVGKGTQKGKPSVDILLEDAVGNKFVVMTTGQLVEMLGGAAEGKRQKDEG